MQEVGRTQSLFRETLSQAGSAGGVTSVVGVWIYLCLLGGAVALEVLSRSAREIAWKIMGYVVGQGVST